jgi:hypothetical protein
VKAFKFSIICKEKGMDIVDDKVIDVDNSGERVAISDPSMTRDLSNETVQANAVQLPENGE